MGYLITQYEAFRRTIKFPNALSHSLLFIAVWWIAGLTVSITQAVCARAHAVGRSVQRFIKSKR